MLRVAIAPVVVALIAAAPAPHAGVGSVARGQRAYAHDRYAEAAVAFHGVAVGAVPGDRAAAQLGLGKALYRLGLFEGAKPWFLRVTKPGHPLRRRGLPWLAGLSRELEPDAKVLAALGTFDEADLADPRVAGVADELQYLLGRKRYDDGELERAVVLLDGVPRSSDEYVAAQFFSGVAKTRLWQGKRSVAAFKNVLRAQADLRRALGPKQLRRVERLSGRRARLERRGWRRALRRTHARMQRRWDLTFADLDRVEQTRRYDEMASLAMAFVFYQAGKFPLALKYFGRVPRSSPFWLDSIFGKAWTEFLMTYTQPEAANEHYQRALGHIHTLGAPFFPYRLYPEAPLLKAQAYYYNCRYEQTALALDEFDRRYSDSRKLIRAVLDRYAEDYRLFELYRRLMAGKSGLDEATAHILEGLLEDNDLERRADLVDRIDDERDRLAAAPRPLASSRLAEELAIDLDLAQSAARESAGRAVRTRLAGATSDIARFERDAIKIRYELAPRLAEARRNPGEAVKVRPSREHERYKYNAEYWQDELGHYLYKVTSLCKE